MPSLLDRPVEEILGFPKAKVSTDLSRGDTGKSILDRFQTSQEILDYYSGRPAKTMKPVKPAEPRGVIAEITSSLGAGFVSTAEALGATAEMIGIPGGKAVREKMQEVGESDMLRRPEYLQEGTVWEKPERLADWRWWVRSLGENAPNMATMYIPGVAAFRGAQALGWGAKAIRAAGLAGAWSGSMSLEAGSAYSQAKDEMTESGTYDADTIERIATLEGVVAGTANSLIELLPFDNLFLKQAGADRFLKRIVRQSLLEGSTESTQEAVNIYVEKLGHKPDQELSANIGRILESGIIGGALGGIAGGTVGTVVHRQNIRTYNALAAQTGTGEMVYTLKGAGVADNEIAAQLDARLKELRGETPADKAPAADGSGLAPGSEMKEIAQTPTIPEVDAQEMVSYLLYGTGPLKPEPGIAGKAARKAKRGVLGVFGLKESTAAPKTETGGSLGAAVAEAGGDDTLVSTATIGKDIAVEKPAAAAREENRKAEARKKGGNLFDTAISEINAENQAHLEELRAQELVRKEEEARQVQAEAEASTQAAVAQAGAEANAVAQELAGDDPKKQAIVGEVMGLSERVVLSSALKDLGMDVRPAGPDRYAAVTPQGAQPVDLPTIRKMLAAKYVADADAAQIAQGEAEKKRLADLEATRQRSEDARIKKEKELATQALANTREELRMRRTLSPQQHALLQSVRDQLTPQEIELLDAGPTVARSPSPPRSLQALGVRGRPAAVVPVKAVAAGLPEEPGRTLAQDAADEAKVREYVLDDLAYQLKNSDPSGWVINAEGDEGRRIAAGGWISRTVKTFGNQSTTPIRGDNGKPVTLNLSKEYLANVIEKTRTGKPLTDQQQAVHDVILREARDEHAEAWRMISAEAEALANSDFNPEEFAPADLVDLKGRWSQQAIERVDKEGNEIVGPAMGQLYSSRTQYNFVGEGRPPAGDVKQLQDAGFKSTKEGEWTGPVKLAIPEAKTEPATINEPFPVYTVSERGLTRRAPRAYNANQEELFNEVLAAGTRAGNVRTQDRGGDGGREVSTAGGKILPYVPGQGTLPTVKSEPIGTWESSRNKITSPEDAAVIARDNLELNAQEQLVFITTDGAGKILAVSQHSVGEPASSSFSPHMAAGQILNTPGASTVWSVHNHPSGEAKLSPSDITASATLRDLVKDAGIEVRSIIAVTADAFSNSEHSSNPLPAKEPKTHKMSILGRKFEQPTRGLDSISGKEELAAFGEIYLRDGGIVLLSAQNEPVAVINIDDYSKLRPLHTELLREAEKRNAIGFVVYDKNRTLSPADFDNLISFGAKSDLGLITILDKAGDHHEIVKQMRIDAAAALRRGEKKIFYALEDNVPVELPAQGLVVQDSVPREILQEDQDWQGGKKRGDMDAARRFADKTWTAKKTERLLDILDNPKEEILYISQPSTTRMNVQPQALAEKLARETDGKSVTGERHFDPAHEEESKKISRSERVDHPREYIPAEVAALRDLAQGRRVVLVEDIFTTGGSAAAFIRALERAGVHVDAHVGYFGEKRLRVDANTVDKLQKALHNANIPVKGLELSKLLTRQEAGGIIQDINQARTENAREKLTERLQRILDRGTSGSAETNANYGLSERGAEGQDLGHERPGQGISPVAGAPTRAESRLESLDPPAISALVRQLAATVKGIKIQETADGRLTIQTKSGQTVEVTGVKQIDADTVSLSLGYGENAAGRQPVGAYMKTETGRVKTILLVRGKAGQWTMNHEFYHFLEDIGAITNADKNLLNRKIGSLVAKDSALAAKFEGVAPAEQRAEWVGRTVAGAYDAKTPTGKIIQKIKDVIDQILNALGIRTAGGVVRDIREGKIYERGTIPGTRRAVGAQYMVSAWHGGRELSGGKFSSDFIGTGEGNQAFGWGLYFTDLEDIARNYADVSKSKFYVKIDGKEVEDYLQDTYSNKDERPDTSTIKEKLIHYYDNMGLRDLTRAAYYLKEDIKGAEGEYQDWKDVGRESEARWAKNRLADLVDVLAIIQSGKLAISKPRNLYQVSLHKGKEPGEYNWLEWDKPVSQQSEKTKKILNELDFVTDEGAIPSPARFISWLDTKAGQSMIREDIGIRHELKTGYDLARAGDQRAFNDWFVTNRGMFSDTSLWKRGAIGAMGTGESVYQELAHHGVNGGYGTGPHGASLFLLKNGIDGVKYPAGSLSGVKADASNYVVFDPNAVTVEKHIQYALSDKAEQAAAAVTGAAARVGNRGLAMMGARTSPAVREGATAFAKHWKEFWQPFSTVVDGDKILAKRYEAMGNVARAVRFIDETYKKLDAYPDQVKKDLFWYLNGDIPLESLPEDARETAQMIRRRIDVIGEMLVDRGILAEGQYEKYKGRYIHYMYAKHVLGEDKPVFLTSTGKLNLSYTKSRNPKLTLQQRKELGLIEDASVAVPVGMGKALTDIAKWDYLDSISDNPDWVWQPSIIRVPIGKQLTEPIHGRTRRWVKMGIGRLVEEAKIYDKMMAEHGTPEVAEIHRILHEALDTAEEESQNMPGDFVQLPNSKGYGSLAGAYVKAPIASDLMPVLDIATDRGKLMNTILEIERQGMATFKMGKVALNFPTAFRNVVSNIIQNNMRGRSLAKIPGDIIRACESLKAKDAYYEEAFGMGLFHTNWFVAEINDVLDEFRKVKAGRIDQLLIALKNVAKYYGKIDDINKLAIFIEQRKAGKPIDEATLEAMKWGMDYSLTSRAIKGLRQTIMPFACVDEKTEGLTKRGWLRYDEIRPGDMMLSLNMERNRLEWKPVYDVYRAPYKGDMLRFKHRSFDMKLTPDHKVVVYRRRRKNYVYTAGYELKYAHDLNTHDQIPVAAPYDGFPQVSRFSDDFVRLAGWVLTEGWYKKSCDQVCISQNEGEKSDEIRSILQRECNGKFGEQRIREKELVFHIHVRYAKHIKWIFPEKQLTPEFVLALPADQLKILVDTMIRGDGSIGKDSRRCFIQKPGPGLDAYQMALCLLGISHGSSPHGEIRSINERKATHYSLRRTPAVHEIYAGTIWCPSVLDNGTWVARRGGNVFITHNTYQYKIAPLIAESLKKRPWVLAKYGLLYTAAKMVAMGFNDLDDDDWEDLEKQLPAYIKKSGSMMILPWKSDKGQWQWVNLEYFFPWGNYLAIARDMKAADLGEGLRDAGISNPFLSMFYTGLSTREDQPPLHSYFGTPIYNQLDPAPVKAAKMLEYMKDVWSPGMLTRQGAAGYTGRLVSSTGILGDYIKEHFGGEDRWGREVSAGQALGRWFGLNIISVSPQQTRAQASVRIQDLRKEMARIDADPSYDEKEKEEFRARLNERLAKVAEEAPAAVLPITKAKGRDPVYDVLQAMAAKGSLHTGPPSRTVEIVGVPYKMTMTQYEEYIDRSSEIARRKLSGLVASPTWKTMSDKRKAEVVSHVMENARKGIRQKIKREIQIANREKVKNS